MGISPAGGRKPARKHRSIDNRPIGNYQCVNMNRATDVISLPNLRLHNDASYSAADPEISAAIRRAQENLLQQQRPDGHWCGELIVDSTLCSDFVLFMHWFGEVDHERQQRCVRN